MFANTMVVSKKVKLAGEKDGKYVKVGEVVVHYPTLKDLGLNIEARTDLTEQETKEAEGFPLYADPKHQYAFDSVCAAVKAQARNRLVTGTATLKDGLSIAETVEQLLESGGGNNGAALAAQRDMLAQFKAFLAASDKTEAAQKSIFNTARNRDSIALLTEDKRKRFLAIVEEFGAGLSDEDMVRFERPLLALTEACEVETAEW